LASEQFIDSWERESPQYQTVLERYRKPTAICLIEEEVLRVGIGEIKNRTEWGPF